MSTSTHYVPKNSSFGPLQTHPDLAGIAAELLWRTGQSTQVVEFLEQSLPLILEVTGADFAALVGSEGAHWNTLGKVGISQALPTALMSDALDGESTAAEAGWVAAPLTLHAVSGELLLLHGALPRTSADSLRTIEALAVIFSSALDVARRRQQEIAQIKG